ncbi:MAG: hypothetical protein M3R49_06970 [Chloroflexota bacterium]|nr:hypothetical protein [Chloroflexota bacterium]
MTRTSLRSAVMEVGLFYQKGWSVDRIARFTFRLHHRRLRALDEAARARRSALASNGPGPDVAYQIERDPDPWIGFEVTQPRVEAWTANEPAGSGFDW